MKRHIANGFTLLNLVFGCISIILITYDSFAADVLKHPSDDAFQILSRQLSVASLFIVGSAIVDFLDGFVARLLGIASELGKQLDSLADVVSFGVAPSLIVVRYLNYIYLETTGSRTEALLFALPALLIAVAGAYRLARFNISTAHTDNFQGVPIPAAGMVTISLPLILTYQNNTFTESLAHNPWFWYVYIIVIAGLMVSRFPILSLKSKDFNLYRDWWKLALAIIATVLSLCIQWQAVPIVFFLYVIFSLIFLREEKEEITEIE